MRSAYGRNRHGTAAPRRLLPLMFAVLIASAAQADATDLRHVELWVGGGVAGTGPNFHVIINADGNIVLTRTGLPIVAPGRLSQSRITVHVSREKAARLLRLAQAAGDFSAGCDQVADGTSARLVVVGKRRAERRCVHAATWPIGRKTAAFLNALNSHLPKAFPVF